MGFFVGFGLSLPIAWLPVLSTGGNLVQFCWLFLEVFVGWPDLNTYKAHIYVEILSDQLDKYDGEITFRKED